MNETKKNSDDCREYCAVIPQELERLFPSLGSKPVSAVRQVDHGYGKEPQQAVAECQKKRDANCDKYHHKDIGIARH